MTRCGAESACGVPTAFLTHCKLLATTLVLVAVLYHWTAVPDPAVNTCVSLLTAGSFVSGDTWQPSDCAMHNYTTQDTKQCLKAAREDTPNNTRIVAVGDSRLRGIYNTFFRQLQINIWVSKKDQMSLKDHIHGYEDLGVTLEYYSRVLINDVTVVKLMERFKEQPPSLLVLGSMLHYLVRYPLDSETGLTNYKKGLKKLVEAMDQLDPRIPVVYKLSEPYYIPNLRRNIDPTKRNDLIAVYNKAAVQILAPTRIILWHSALTIGTNRTWDYPDGVHASNKTDMYYVQMLLNLYCNRYLPALPPNSCCQHKDKQKGTPLWVLPSAPAPATRNYAPRNDNDQSAVKIIVAGVGFTSIFLLFLFMRRKGMPKPSAEKESSEVVGREGVSITISRGGELLLYENDNINTDFGGLLHEKNKFNKVDDQNNKSINQIGAPEPKPQERLSTPQKNKGQVKSPKAKRLEIVWSLLKLGLILAYFVLCDRVSWFQTGAKEFSALAFGLPLGVALLVAIFTGRKLPESDSEETILNRNITDEWKGWMQLVIVIYHLSGASQSVPIYVLVRALVSAYLFLTGYGHFTRYWRTGDAGGVVRYCQVMFRLNFLTVLLCLVMSHPYMNYYFVALVSFWFTALHGVLSLPPRLDGRWPKRPMADYGRGALKITLLAALVAVLALAEGLFTDVFGSWPLAHLFHLPAQEGVEEWRFRWMLDRFSALYGMAFALAVQAWTQLWSGNTVDQVWPGSKTRTIFVCLASSVCACSYFVLPQLCHEKTSCNALHPYVTWIPILGYIFFRHHCRLLRQHFSPMFAWLGRLSLELFVSQYHILLAANTHRVLVLVPGPLNFLVTGFVFLCVAHELNLITETLQQVLVPSDWRVVGVYLVIASLVVMALSHGSLQQYVL